MTVCELSDDDMVYAQEVQAAIHGLMRKYSRSVGLESQMATIGVVIGAMLLQLCPEDRAYYSKILMANIEDAPILSDIVRYH